MIEISKTATKYLWYLQNVYEYFDRDLLLIQNATKVADLAHKWQYRNLTGKDFVAHPMRVAIMVAKKSNDLAIVLAAILHDVVEDSSDKFSMSYIYENFWDEIGFLVDSVTSTINHFYKMPQVLFDTKIDKFLYATMQDVRCAYLKLKDREHNNKTLQWLKTDKQIRKSFETQVLYSPLRKILGLDNKSFVYHDMQKNFQQYLKKNKIKTVEQFKEHLYNKTFLDMNICDFDLFYYSSKNVVRKIKDKKMFENLVKNNYFDNLVEIISLTQNAEGGFACLFRYKWWKICNQKIQVSVSNFNY